ncbi:Ripening-related protein 3 [Rhynchospora pubera]|uniref:Ripening-related protein 3 n=1 Tax=Rhynchospora pubera TaxID=906938 RepID=A0AAV8GIW8_9POAL|nr:Ripening-related protein 3 [Rhynchospora pubera]
MQKQLLSSLPITLLLLLSTLRSTEATIQIVIGTCHASSYLTGKSGFCTTQNDADCCQEGQLYPQYRCSPPVTANTNAVMYIGSFSQNSDGGSATACDGKFYADNETVVALSTGWFNGGSRCLKNIRINGNGNSVMAKVVDECDSVNGCTADLNYEPPCVPNAITASPAVWKELGVPETQRSELVVTWSEVLSS